MILELGRKMPIELESSHHDTGRYANLIGKRCGILLIERASGRGEVAVSIRWDKSVSRESIGFDLMLFASRVLVIDIDWSLTVAEDVAGLVKKGEPHVIVSLVPQAELNEWRSTTGEPTCRAADVSPLQLLHEHQDDTCLQTERRHLSLYDLGWLQSEVSDQIQRLFKSAGVKLGTNDLFSSELA
jgi:hypothetical protein